MKQVTSAFLGACAFLLLSARHASAYLDPGSGSMLLQLLLGGVAGVVVLGKVYWRRLLTRLGLTEKNGAQVGAEVHADDASAGDSHKS